MICPLESDCIPSPLINHYRNKCEFSLGVDSNNLPAAGFLLQKTNTGKVTVETPENCPNIAPISVYACESMTSFIRKYVHLYPVYHRLHHTGVLRMCTVRHSTETKQIMLAVQISKKQLNDTQLNELCEHVREHFCTSFSGDTFLSKFDNMQLSSLLLQIHDAVSEVASETCEQRVLHGSPYITDIIHNLRFRVSLHSFFQVNIPAATKLYELAGNLAKCTEKTTLLDICCGTGTIGLIMSKQVKNVIGLELVESAIEDAKINASENDVKNCKWVVGKAEDTLNSVLKEHAYDSDIVGIVDPPRSGLRKKMKKYKCIYIYIYL